MKNLLINKIIDEKIDRYIKENTNRNNPAISGKGMSLLRRLHQSRRITEITRRYFSQLKKDGFVIYHNGNKRTTKKASQSKNATRVNYHIERYQKLDN